MNIRLTKYNPLFRDSSGIYLRNEWTSSGDIGKTFESGILTPQEYLKKESEITKLIVDIINLYSSSELVIDYFELYDKHDNLICELSNQTSSSFINELIVETHIDLQESTRSLLKSLLDCTSLKNGKVIPSQKIEDCIKLCLRDVFYLRIIAKNNTYITFGHDYYIYVGSDNQPSSWDISIPQGLYVEYCPPPRFL